VRPQRTVFKNAEIPGRIHAMLPFLSEGRLPDGTRRWSGYSGPATSFGHLPARYRATARLATYVVYSYETPIAWVWSPEAEGDDRGDWTEWYEVPDVGYSVTTGQHQYACLEAWADELRRQGTYRRGPRSHREVVRVPGNAEAYGRTIRARAGGVDGVRPGEAVGRASLPLDDLSDITDDSGFSQGLPVRSWSHHSAHP
jgi:hypothetical protein